MQRAAAGLAAAATRRLGRVYGVGSPCWSAAGTTAGTRFSPPPGWRPAKRRCRAAVADGTEEGGRRRPLRVGRGGGDDERQATRPGPDRGADLVLDGMVGIGGRGGLRARRGAGRRRPRGRPGRRGRPAERGRRGHRRGAGSAVRAEATVTFGTLKPGLLMIPARTQAGAASWVDIGVDPYLRPARVGACSPPTWPRCCRAERGSESTAGACSGSWPGSEPSRRGGAGGRRGPARRPAVRLVTAEPAAHAVAALAEAVSR